MPKSAAEVKRARIMAEISTLKTYFHRRAVGRLEVSVETIEFLVEAYEAFPRVLKDMDTFCSALREAATELEKRL